MGNVGLGEGKEGRGGQRRAKEGEGRGRKGRRSCGEVVTGGTEQGLGDRVLAAGGYGFGVLASADGGGRCHWLQWWPNGDWSGEWGTAQECGWGTAIACIPRLACGWILRLSARKSPLGHARSARACLCMPVHSRANATSARDSRGCTCRPRQEQSVEGTQGEVQ